MQKAIFDRDEEIESLKEKFKKQKQQMNKALKLANQVMACRPPPRVYAICLKDQFLLFQLMMTMRDIDCEFKNAQDFYNVYQTLPSWQKNCCVNSICIIS